MEKKEHCAAQLGGRKYALLAEEKNARAKFIQRCDPEEDWIQIEIRKVLFTGKI